MFITLGDGFNKGSDKNDGLKNGFKEIREYQIKKAKAEAEAKAKAEAEAKAKTNKYEVWPLTSVNPVQKAPAPETVENVKTPVVKQEKDVVKECLVMIIVILSMLLLVVVMGFLGILNRYF